MYNITGKIGRIPEAEKVLLMLVVEHQQWQPSTLSFSVAELDT